MSRQENEQVVRTVFARARDMYARLATGFVEDTDAVLEEAVAILDGMIPGMAYVDKPAHPMASAVFECSATLAVTRSRNTMPWISCPTCARPTMW